LLPGLTSNRTHQPIIDQADSPKGSEHVAKGATEFRLDDCFDDVPGQRRSLVLQFGQFNLIRGGQQVGARGKDLSQLDKGRAQFFQRQQPPLGALLSVYMGHD